MLPVASGCVRSFLLTSSVMEQVHTHTVPVRAALGPPNTLGRRSDEWCAVIHSNWVGYSRYRARIIFAGIEISALRELGKYTSITCALRCLQTLCIRQMDDSYIKSKINQNLALVRNREELLA